MTVFQAPVKKIWLVLISHYVIGVYFVHALIRAS